MFKTILKTILCLFISTSICFATVSSSTSRNDYLGNGNVDTYSYSFRIFNNTDLLVTVRNTSGVESTLSLTTDYTVTGVGNSSGGNVVLVNSSQSWIDGDGDLKSGYTLSIRRVRPITQETDIRNQGAYYPEIHEDEFDILTMIDQQQQDEIDRSIKLSETSDPDDFDTKIPSSIIGNAGASFIVNDTGDGFTDGPTATDIAEAEENATAAAASALASSTSASLAQSAVANVIYLWGGSVGGTGNAITLTPSPAISSYVTGMRFAFLATNSNSGAVTVAISGLSAKSIKTQSGAALSSGEITSGRVYSMTYDGTNFVIHELSTPEDGVVTNAKVASGASIDYSKLNLSSSITHTDVATGYGLIPTGGIIMWSGTVATIPTGWELADGSCSITCPDLRDKFIVGATSDDSGAAKTNYTGSLTQSGGSVHHTHTFSATTGNASGGVVNVDGSSSPVSGTNHTHDVSGTTANENAVPVAYYALAFIIKT